MKDSDTPCRVMFTRTCPRQWEGGCGTRPCARFESSDEAPWIYEIESGLRPLPTRSVTGVSGIAGIRPERGDSE